jgi:hypothetical protein
MCWEIVKFYQFSKIWSCQDTEWFFPDPDPAKNFRSHRIRINYTDYIALKVKMLQTFQNSPFFVAN